MFLGFLLKQQGIRLNAGAVPATVSSK